ncbi:MAG: hybrid sensor histidine kinase/response regulator [Gemmatimonadales bacterium]
MTGSARKVAERERDERYQQLVELAPDGILIHDGERIVLANAAAVRLAGATNRIQLVGQLIETFLTPPYLKAVQAQLLSSGDVAEVPPPVRDLFRRLDGSQVEVEVTAIAFMDHGRLSAHLVIRDITERLAVQQAARQVEKHLQQAQRMETVGALAGGVAHEINNMMSVILGFSEFLLQDPALQQEQRSEVEQIAKAANRAASVTGQLLSFSRRAFHEPQVVDLGAAARDLEPIIRRLLGEGRQLVLAADAPARVMIDPRQLEQVIVNLALNARDAMRDGGTLTITTKEAEFTGGARLTEGVAIAAGQYGLLVVRDTGDGMDAATQLRIFEPFFTTKAVGEGTGLGLAAVYGIIKQNSGYITVASAPGRGAAFTLYLPILSDVTVREKRVDPASMEGDGRHAAATILLVEDESAVRTVATRSLEVVGFRVIEASDGADALEVVARHGAPDLLLTDLVMPGISGAELARRLRERWPALPVLFMSDYSAADLCRQGALAFEGITLQKPFTPDVLVRSVVEALSNQSQGSAR